MQSGPAEIGALGDDSWDFTALAEVTELLLCVSCPTAKDFQLHCNSILKAVGRVFQKNWISTFWGSQSPSSSSPFDVQVHMCLTVPDAIVCVCVQLCYQFIWVRQCWKIWLHCCCFGNTAKTWLCHCNFCDNRKKKGAVTDVNEQLPFQVHHPKEFWVGHCTCWSTPSLTQIIVNKFN